MEIQNNTNSNKKIEPRLRSIGKKVISILYILGIIYFGIPTVGMAVIAIISGLKGNIEDFPRFLSPEYFWMVALACSLIIILSFLLFGRKRLHARIAYVVTFLILFISIGFLIVGITTDNRYYGDETNVGLCWIFHSLVLLVFITYKNLEVRRKAQEETAKDVSEETNAGGV